MGKRHKLSQRTHYVRMLLYLFIQLYNWHESLSYSLPNAGCDLFVSMSCSILFCFPALISKMDPDPKKNHKKIRLVYLIFLVGQKHHITHCTVQKCWATTSFDAFMTIFVIDIKQVAEEILCD